MAFKTPSYDFVAAEKAESLSAATKCSKIFIRLLTGKSIMRDASKNPIYARRASFTIASNITAPRIATTKL
ncbi:MAG: hypothetical protein JWL75_103 [Parcubacteria group bacterium]|nr:hypothetical protein [Parcubacteria group bacterium]